METMLNDLKAAFDALRGNLQEQVEALRQARAGQQALGAARQTNLEALAQQTKEMRQVAENAAAVAMSTQPVVDEALRRLVETREATGALLSHKGEGTARTARQAVREYLDSIAEIEASLGRCRAGVSEGKQALLGALAAMSEHLTEAMEALREVCDTLGGAAGNAATLADEADACDAEQARQRAEAANREGCRALACGHAAAAARLFARSCDLEPTSTGYWHLAIARYLQGSNSGSEDALNKAVAAGLPAGHAEAMRALLALAVGDNRTSVQAAKAALAEQPENWTARAAASLACLARGSVAEAIQHLAAARRLRPLEFQDLPAFQSLLDGLAPAVDDAQEVAAST